MNRRNIIRNGALAGVAIMAPAAAATAAQSQQSVMARLSVYSGKIHTVTSGSEVHLLASLDNLTAFVDPTARQKALPYENMKAEGNSLSFTHGKANYKIENLLPQDFDARVKALS